MRMNTINQDWKFLSRNLAYSRTSKNNSKLLSRRIQRRISYNTFSCLQAFYRFEYGKCFTYLPAHSFQFLQAQSLTLSWMISPYHHKGFQPPKDRYKTAPVFKEGTVNCMSHKVKNKLYPYSSFIFSIKADRNNTTNKQIQA